VPVEEKQGYYNQSDMTLNEFERKYGNSNWLRVRSAAINSAVKKHEKQVLDLNRNDQLYDRGVDNFGGRLSPDYAPSTIRKKGKKGQPTDRVTLRDTGVFHRSFFLNYRSDEIEFMAEANTKRRDFSLLSWLKSRYGKGILGLTEENIEKLKGYISQEIIRVFSNAK
jgi:hypothetical protein